MGPTIQLRTSALCALLLSGCTPTLPATAAAPAVSAATQPAAAPSSAREEREDSDRVPFDAEARVAELALLRDVLRDSYAHLETKRAQWGVELDAVYDAYAPLLRRASSWSRYARVMAAFVAEFHDAHLTWRRQRGPTERRRRVVRLGLSTRFVGEALIVADIWPGSAVELAGLRLGDRLVAIDGETIEGRLGRLAAVRSWSRAESARHDFASDWPAARVYVGEPPEPWRVTRERADGGYETLLIAPETAPRTGARPPRVQLEQRGPVQVLRLRSFVAPRQEFEREISELAAQIFAAPRGLVVDLRGNSGGFEDNARATAAQLTVRPLRGGHTRVRLSARSRAARPVWRELAEDPTLPGWSMAQAVAVEPLAPRAYPGQIAVLLDAGCRSACESLALLLRALGARLIGERSGGSSGAAIQVTLPASGARVRVPARAMFDLRSVPLEGVGVAPDTWAAPTREELSLGRDSVLARGIAHVSGRQSSFGGR